ncbi:Thiol-disulfide isomerase or thioredoxin [Chitinophaga costaii]|uniref:Thiol-disulfide isomerase or thioredoxin n=1 Tax=Chitinophaga costaii TaxID=1335309 RepID=A0A1C3YQS2_9BACT|nr:TlpA disulfide reductase family protein [Chitinophaga costaii]PUZ30060.1 hypothetical protein DCM91_00845 [Chitinophaga costaii]SCB72429.1 Thiol-disulfide isomerase or thioredoxin [Chitinophaga costaii]
MFRKENVVLLIIFNLALFSNTLANANNSRLTIHGSLSPNAPDIGTLTIEFYNHYFFDLTGKNCILKKIIVNGRRFDYSSPKFNNTAFIKIKIDYSKYSNYYQLSKEIFVASPGDNIDLKIDSTDFIFTGKDSERYFFSNKIAKIQPILSQPFDGMSEEMMDYVYNAYNTAFLKRMEILHQLSNRLPARVTKQIEFDLKCKENYEYNRCINKMLLTLNNDTIEKVIKPSFFKYSSHFLEGLNDSTLITNSPYYYDFVFKMLRNINMMFHPTQPGDIYRTNFSYIFSSILSDYDGQTKYALLVCALTDFIVKDSTDQYFDAALKEIPSNNYCYNILHNIKTKFGRGATVPNYALKDTSNQTFYIEKLKGKVIILDFWFTGCTGCKQLANAMKRVHEVFDSSKDVIFVSISVDKDINEWRKSVLSGVYASKSIDLYTNGMAEEHPLIKYYNFRGFPQLMLIGKDGRIFYSEPPIPSRPQTTNRFIEIVRSAI